MSGPGEPGGHSKQIRHWSLIRMLYWPARSPLSASSRLPPMAASSLKLVAASRRSSRTSACRAKPPGRVKLRPRCKQIKGRADGSSARGGTCGFVILPPQPGTKTETANGPGFSAPIDHEIRERGAIGDVKQLRADRQVGKHISRRYLVPWARRSKSGGAQPALSRAMRVARDDTQLIRRLAAPSAEGDIGNAFPGDIIQFRRPELRQCIAIQPHSEVRMCIAQPCVPQFIH